MFFGFNFTLFEQEVTAHPQVDEEAEIRQVENKIFGAAPDILNHLSFDQLTELFGAGKRKRARPAQSRILDRLSEQVRFEFACNGFDFR